MEMGRYEIRNYGPNKGLIFKGVWMNFWKGSRPQYTDDPVLAEAAGELDCVEVIDREPPKSLEDMNVKELVKRAKTIGLSGLSRKPKKEIIETIKLAALEGVTPATMEE